MPEQWLLKTEPGEYSYDDLARDGTTMWDGVANPVALKNMRAMKKGDQVFIYHTGSEKAVVGTARVMANPGPARGSKDPKFVVVKIQAERKLNSPVGLHTIKSDKRFAGFELVRLPRLSVMPVPRHLWERILRMGS